MAKAVVHSTLISGYLAVKGLSIINKQSKIVTVIKKWQQLWVVLGQANTSQWLLAIYQDKNNWIRSQKPLTIHQIIQLHSFTDKQTSDGLHMFLLKFAGNHKISFACKTPKQKSEWLTAVQKALDACYNRKQKGNKSAVDDWWQLSEHQENTTEFRDFQVAVIGNSLTENINQCQVRLFHDQGYMEVYGHSTYSSYTVQWIWQYTQLYCITFNKQTLTLIIQLYIRDSLEEICWSGNETLQLYNTLCNIPGVWDCTTREAASVPGILPTLVRLEESDYTSVGVFLPDWLVQKMKDWYLVELICCQHQPQLLGQYEAQLSLTHLHFKGCNCPHCWSWELHHIKSYSYDTDQLIVEFEGASDVQSGVFHFTSSCAHSNHITTLYQLLRQLMIKLHLVVMIKQELITTRKQLSIIMNHNQTLHNAIECFSCELLKGPSQDLLGHYTLQIFVDKIHVISSNNVKWVWLLTEIYSYMLDQEELGRATFVTIQVAKSAPAVTEQWVWAGDHMIRLYSFLLELCQYLSQQSSQEVLISQIAKVRVIIAQSVTIINTYTVQLTMQELILINSDSQEVISSYPLDCIKSLNLVEDKNELIVCTNETPALQASKLVIATNSAQKLLVLLNKAIQNKQPASSHHHSAQQMMDQSQLENSQSQLETKQLLTNHREIVHHISDERASVESQEVEHKTPTETPVETPQQIAQQHSVGAQIPTDDQQASVKTMHHHPIEAHQTLTDTTNTAHNTSWKISCQPQVVDAEKQAMVKTQEIKHQQISNMAKKIMYQSVEPKQMLTETNQIVQHDSCGFQEIPPTETQQLSHKVKESKQLLIHDQQMITTAQQMTQRPQVQTQQISSKSQQASFEKKTALEPSLETPQAPKESSQNAYWYPVKLDEAKEVIHETWQTSIENQQQVTHQTLVDTQVSVETQEMMQLTSYQSQVEQMSMVNTLLTSQLDTPTDSYTTSVEAEKVSNQQSPKTTQILNKLQSSSVVPYGKCPMDTMQPSALAQDVVYHPNTLQQILKYEPQQTKFQLPEETEVQRQPFEKEYASITKPEITSKLPLDATVPTLQISQEVTYSQLEPSLEAPQAPKESSQNVYRCPVKLDEAKKVIHKTQQTSVENKNQQQLTHQTSVDTQVSVETQEIMQLTSYQSQVEQTSKVNTLLTSNGPQLDTPTDSHKILDDEVKDITHKPVEIHQTSSAIQEESTRQLSMLDHQALIMSNHATFQIPAEAQQGSMIKQMTVDAQQITTEPYQISEKYPPTETQAMSDQQQTVYQHPDEANAVKDQHLPVEQISYGQPQLQQISQNIMQQQPSDETQQILIETKDSRQLYQHPVTTTMQVPVEVEKVKHHRMLNKPQQISDQLLVETEQILLKDIDYHPPPETQITHENIPIKTQQTSHKVQHILQVREDPHYTLANTEQLLNDSPQQIVNNSLAGAGTKHTSTASHNILHSSSTEVQQSLPASSNSEQMWSKLQEVSHLLDEEQEAVLMMETNDIKSTVIIDTQQKTSNDVRDQSPFDYEQISHQCIFETPQQISDNVKQAVQHDSLNRTLANANQFAQVEQPQCPEVETVHASVEAEKLTTQQSPKTPQILNKLQSVVAYDECPMDTMEPSALAQDVVYHPNTLQQILKYEPQQITFQFPEKTEEQQQPFEKEYASTTKPEITSKLSLDATVPTLQISQEVTYSQLDETQQERSTDTQQVGQAVTIEAQEPQEVLSKSLQSTLEQSPTKSLHTFDDTKEVVDEVLTEIKEIKYHLPANNTNKIFTEPQEISQFPVDAQELPAEGNYTTFQLPLSEEVPFKSHQMSVESALIQIKEIYPTFEWETQKTALHQISIDYKHKMIETQKVFHEASALDKPHIIKHQFPIEAQYSEWLDQPQQALIKTQEIKYQPPDEIQSVLVESRQLEKKQQISVESHISNSTEIPADSREVIPAETPVEIQPIMFPVKTPTMQETVDQPTKGHKYVNPQQIEFDEEVVTLDFTDSNQMTRNNISIVTITPSDGTYHHQLHTDNITYIISVGEQTSTSICYCYSYHFVISTEKKSQKKRFNGVSTSAYHQYDLQSTRKAIDELLLKYL